MPESRKPPIVTPVSADVLFEWIDEYYELDDKEAYEKEMQKQEAAQTSKKKKRTVKKPAKPLAGWSAWKRRRRCARPEAIQSKKEQTQGAGRSVIAVSDIRKNEKCGSTCLCGRAEMLWTGIFSLSAVTKKKMETGSQKAVWGRGYMKIAYKAFRPGPVLSGRRQYIPISVAEVE